MRAFSELFRQLDETNKTSDKLAALRHYFEQEDPASAAWAVWFLSGNKLPLRIHSRQLLRWAAQLTAYPDWLISDCYNQVGDLAETTALLLPLTPSDSDKGPSLHSVVTDHLLPLQHWHEGFQFNLLRDFWLSLPRRECFIVNKLLTGGLRIGVSRQLLLRALAEHLGVDRALLTHRLMGDWSPSAEFFQSLGNPTADPAERALRPYPFYLACPLEQAITELGSPHDWLAEWKWDGLRAQLIHRNGTVHLWSRGDENITAAFPEIHHTAKQLPHGTVLDGEVLCWQNNRPLPFHFLQRRIGRKEVGEQLRREAPAVFLAFDCLEANGHDLRAASLLTRRTTLAQILAGRPAQSSSLQLSEPVPFRSWDDLTPLWHQSRQRGVEGLLLKGLHGTYQTGRVRADWWKWKVDPYTADLVLVYAQAGHGRRAGLFSDYTLAAWHGSELVPVAKAYSGLSNEELRSFDQWIKRHTLSRRGPVRTVPPHHVFEIAFEDIRPSSRHRSGIALRFPRILRHRTDKSPADADHLHALTRLLNPPA